MEKLLHLIFLVTFSALCGADNVTVVTGLEGETISIRCAYSPQENKWREKSWCKHVNQTECQHVVSAHRFWLQFLRKRSGNTSIADDVYNGVLTVTMKGLQKQDAGLYQCRTDFLGEARTLQRVKVQVLGGLMETQAPEEPRAEHSISRNRGTRATREESPEESHNLNQHQLLPLTAQEN
ncbi:triggering receptor expressed on myeloid cells 2-like isoform X4 [Pelodiscus sinensis]|uniref:triggering receptor expressed on myeloid cells 2-like isoform X4 n=1 Tax=Pelodiscus sinensis TaxID=13735 RepID=UPI003F6D56E7